MRSAVYVPFWTANKMFGIELINELKCLEMELNIKIDEETIKEIAKHLAQELKTDSVTDLIKE